MALRSATKRKTASAPASPIASPAEPTTALPRRAARTTKQDGQAADRALQEVLNRLPHEKVRCLDVETTGLDWRKNCIVGYVCTFGPKPSDTYYIPFRHAGNANVGGRPGMVTPHGWDGVLAPGERDLIDKLDRAGTLMIGHNLAFDLRFMSRVGFQLRPKFEDTSINEPLLDEYARYSLEQCCIRHKVQAKLSAEIKAHIRSKFADLAKVPDKDLMGHYWRLAGDDPMAVDYAAGDGTSTWQLRDAQMMQIEAQELGRVHSVESRLIPVLARMMIRGVKIDTEYLQGAIAGLEIRAANLLDQFPAEFNPLSSGDVQKWMEKHGHCDWPMTAASKTFPNGKPSFTEKYLKTHDAGKLILELRKINNLVSSFCAPLLNEHTWNGRVHTTFNQLRNDEFGTVTGRLSSSGPNLQQVPKHNEELGKIIRAAYVPDYGVWGERDYSQIEPRLMAYYTRAKVFLNDYRNNPEADSHTAVAKDARPDWDMMSKEEQKHFRNTWAKRVNQTVITGGGKTALMHRYEMSEQEAMEAIARYRKTVPELQPFQKKAARLFRTRGWVMDLLGRRAHLKDPDKDYTAMNRLLQMSNASMLKLKMVEVDDYLEGESKAGQRPAVEMLLNCHDALSFQFDESARAVYDQCRVVMEDFHSASAVIKVDLPIRVDEGEGKNWAEATYG